MITNKKAVVARRRVLLGLGASASAGLFSLGLPKNARSQEGSVSYDGPLVLTIVAAGGWDPYFYCDPSSNPEYNKLSSDVATAGGLRYSPVELVETMDDYSAELLSNEQFFTAHAQRTTVINGVNFATVAHGWGRIQALTGSPKQSVVFPNLAALTAAVHAPQLPMAFSSTGGVENTADVVGLTRIGGMDSVVRAAKPYLSDDGTEYEPSAVRSLIREAVDARAAERAEASHWTRDRDESRRYLAARRDMLGLEGFDVPTELDDIPGPILEAGEDARVILAAMGEGLCAGGNLGLGGFDTHGDHDAVAPILLAKLNTLLDFVWREAETIGIAPRLTVVVSSDFGRSPKYSGTGKGHHQLGSFLVMSDALGGGREVGGRKEDGGALALNRESLEPDDGGAILTPQAVHASLREHLGVHEHKLSQHDFRLDVSPFRIFG